MLCLISPQNDPYFNIAAEEYFLKSTDEEVCMFYINNPSIVAGKHQNLLAEINLVWARENRIVLARRISGGGTVYHDHGNLNFSFISNCPNLEEISYRRFTMPIVMALKSLGINAEYSGRNDLLLNESKISGNAMHIFKKRVLCHGTLLYNTKLKDLSAALKNDPGKYIDKSIKSIPSKVVNISESLDRVLTMNVFTNILFEETCKYFHSTTLYNLNLADNSEIVRLSDEKYSTWDWIFGYSPKYAFKNEIKLYGQSVKFEINVEKGVIRGYNFEEQDEVNGRTTQLFNALLNLKHDYQTLKDLILKDNLLNGFQDYSAAEFCNHLF